MAKRLPGMCLGLVCVAGIEVEQSNCAGVQQALQFRGADRVDLWRMDSVARRLGAAFHHARQRIRQDEHFAPVDLDQPRGGDRRAHPVRAVDQHDAAVLGRDPFAGLLHELPAGR